MKAIIMRGIPGAGKSTYCDRLGGQKVVCSADIAHVTKGKYKFNPLLKDKAHKDCLRWWLETLIEHKRRPYGYDWLVCDNTNIQGWEIAAYYRLAELYLTPVEIIRIEVDPFLAAKRNQHDVPVKNVFTMYDLLRAEKLPGHWNERVILADGVIPLDMRGTPIVESNVSTVKPKNVGCVGERQLTRAEVMEARKKGAGCCDRYADNKACDCMGNAIMYDASKIDTPTCSICNDPNCQNPGGKH